MKYRLYQYGKKLIIRVTNGNQVVRVIWVAEASRVDIENDFDQEALNNGGVELDISEWEVQLAPTSGQINEVKDACVLSVYVYIKHKDRYKKEIESLTGFSKDAFDILKYIIGSEEVALGYLGTFEDIHKKYSDT